MEISAITGLLGVLIGCILTELIRRKNRVEYYCQQVFTKRLAVHEKLFSILQKMSARADDVIANAGHTREQRHALVSEIVIEVASFCDEEALYLDDRLTVHCTAVMMGVEDIHDMAAEDDRTQAIHDFQHQLREAKRMVKESCGMKEAETLYHRIYRTILKSDVIDYYSAAKKEGKR